jgi:hypothetical protein
MKRREFLAGAVVVTAGITLSGMDPSPLGEEKYEHPLKLHAPELLEARIAPQVGWGCGPLK